MAHEFSGSALIDRPIDEVFAFLADGTNDPKFSPRVQEIRKTTDGPVGVGTMFESTVKDVGMTTRRKFEVTEMQAPTRIRWSERSKNMITVPEGGYDLERVSDTQTRVTIRNTFEGHGFGKVIVGFALRRPSRTRPPLLSASSRRLRRRDPAADRRSGSARRLGQLESPAMGGAKELLCRALDHANLDLHRRHKIPFGVRWREDITYYLQGRALGTAFDVGAHRGETTLKLLRAFPGTHVHSFEPLPESFAVLKQATAASGTRNSILNAAVSDSSGTLTMARGDETYHASVYGGGEKVEVQSVTVDDYAREHGLDRIGLLKIDTEGHEEAVLRGALGLLDRGAIEFIVCECEFTARPEEPHADFRALQDLLEPFGYRVVSFYTGGVDNLGWIWGDVLFRFSPGVRDHDAWKVSPNPERRILGLW